jgi:1-acyl-sn-glycerol-3-phosphate acyltransferase
MRAAVRTFLTLAGLRVRVIGQGNVPVDTPFVAVANHASYLDGLIVLAALPRPATFVVKADFARYRFTLGLMMRRIGVVFVSHDRPATRRLVDAARDGRSIVLFPEGGIDDSRGLAPFHMGAFVIATRCALPILPMVIHGSSRVLPPDRWRPRCASISLQFAPPIPPEAPAPGAITTLHEATRQAIAAHLEARLDPESRQDFLSAPTEESRRRLN